MLTDMPTLELICLLVASMSVAYYLGRRSARSAPAWYGRRRSRLARQAVSLMALGAATRCQRSLRRRFRPSRTGLSSRWRSSLRLPYDTGYRVRQVRPILGEGAKRAMAAPKLPQRR